MNLNGIRNDGGAAISALLLDNNTTQTAANGETSSANASSAASHSSVSKPGELMAKLSQLQQQDPAKFKQVTQQIADELKTEAQSASDPQAQLLSKLGDDLAQASRTGSLSPLAPPNGERARAAGAHHRHGGHQAGAGSAAGGIESVLSKALSEVNLALSAGSIPASATSTSLSSAG